MSRLYAGVRHVNGLVPAQILARADGSVLAGMPADLRKDAAASWNRARKDVLKRTGYPLGLRGWNRSLAEQSRFFHERYSVRLFGNGPYNDVRWYKGARYVRVRGAAAAIPGTSNHGWGLAIDVDNYGGVGQFNNPRRLKTYSTLARHGWSDTEGRGIHEPWHLVYVPSRDKYKSKRKRTLKTDGKLGKGTITEWQKQRKTRRDGVISVPSSLIRSVQSAINRKSGHGGFRLKKGPLTVDGVLGRRTWKAIQSLLNVWGARKSGKKRISLKRPLKVDGLPGRRTVIALQKSLNKKLW